VTSPSRSIMLASSVAGLIIAGLLIGVGVYSYRSTAICVDGRLPNATARIILRDTAGNPIRGASLTIQRRKDNTFFGSPVLEYRQLPLTSDDGGVILCHGSGAHFGGTSRRLFWLVSLGDISVPRFDCEVTYPGYVPLQFDLMRLFDRSTDTGNSAIRAHGAMEREWVFEHRLIMRKVVVAHL
jgi:hypothetical protein